MQHFGAPTRLIDFTHSPYVAAYFAFEDLPTDGCTHCAVIAVNPIWCHYSLGALALEKGGMFGFDLADLHAAMTTAQSVVTSGDEDIWTEQFTAGVTLSRVIERDALSNEHSMVAIFEPDRLSERMSAQQGVFLWSGNVNETLMQNIEAFGDPAEGVRVFRVPLLAQGRALEHLRLMNITRTSLFPGLEGFAQSFRQLTVREPREARVIRAALRNLNRAAHPPQTNAKSEPES